MKSLKILLLVHKSLIPPVEKFSNTEIENKPWKTEYDVKTSLERLGHTLLVLGVDSDISEVGSAIDNFVPQIVFNLLEEFAGEAVFDQNIVSYLEMLGVKYTGSDARGLILGRDKVLAKQLLIYHGIPTPNFYIFRERQKNEWPEASAYPLFVKPRNEEASLGITQDSIVKNQDQLASQLDHYFQKYQIEVIAENYIEGREFYVGVIGNDRLKVLPVWELFFDNLGEGVPRVATSKVKWDFAYRKKYGIRTGAAKDITTEKCKEIQDLAARTYRALYLTGYARMDLRMDDKGNIFVLEANPNPDCGFKEDLSDSALKEGLSYDDLMTKILSLGLNRKK